MHGYDIVDHTQVNPEAGGEEQLVGLLTALRERGMGFLVDVVPNHMSIATSENRWWQDVLENGPGSPYARYFDIDWSPPNPTLQGRVLLPILGDQFGRVLERRSCASRTATEPSSSTTGRRSCPFAARSATLVLGLALEGARTLLGDARPAGARTGKHHHGARKPAAAHRDRPGASCARDVARRRSSADASRRSSRRATRCAPPSTMRSRASTARRGAPQSFDLLEELLGRQAYRLSFWRVASDEINYRRFFDVNELAAVRVEERARLHRRPRGRLYASSAAASSRVCASTMLTGCSTRSSTCADLQREAARGDGTKDVGTGSRASRADAPFYVVVEKILGHDELLRREWPVHGTTGYEFMNLLNGVFVDASNAQALRELYAEFTGARVKFSDLVYECKRLILSAAMSSGAVRALAPSGRASPSGGARRATSRSNSLHHALTEVIACFPVYRSYIRRTQDSVEPRRPAQHQRGGARGQAAQPDAGRLGLRLHRLAAAARRPEGHDAQAARRAARLRAALPAAHQPGHGQGARRHGLLPLLPARLAERGRRRARRSSASRSNASTSATATGRRRGRTRSRPPRRTTPSAARTCARASTSSPRCPRSGTARSTAGAR